MGQDFEELFLTIAWDAYCKCYLIPIFVSVSPWLLPIVFEKEKKKYPPYLSDLTEAQRWNNNLSKVGQQIPSRVQIRLQLLLDLQPVTFTLEQVCSSSFSIIPRLESFNVVICVWVHNKSCDTQMQCCVLYYINLFGFCLTTGYSWKTTQWLTRWSKRHGASVEERKRRCVPV